MAGAEEFDQSSLRRWDPWLLAALVAGFIAGGAGIVALAAVLANGSPAALIGGRFPWYLSRAAGITAYLLLSGSTLLGLGITTRGLDRWISRPSSFALHEHLSWLALGFVLLHIAALLVDQFLPFSLPDVLLPFASTYRTVSVASGVLSLYLLAILIVSFYARATLGHAAWRTLHYASFLLYLLATLHGIFTGSSSGQIWMEAMYFLSAASVGALTVMRLRGRRPAAKSGRAAASGS